MIDSTGTLLLGFSRLFAINLDGSDVVSLGQSNSRYSTRLRQNNGNIIDWLSGVEGKVLMAQEFIPEIKKNSNIVRRDDGLAVVEVDIANNKSKKVESANSAAQRYLSDGQGNVRMVSYGIKENTRGYSTGESKIAYRLKGDRKWLDFSRYNGSDGDDFWPMAVDAKTNSVFGLQKKDGREALYSVSLDEAKTRKLIFAHDKVDVGGIVRFGEGGRVVGVHFAVDRPETVYFDTYLAGLSKKLSKALPKLPIVDFLDASTDENRLLIYAGSDSDPGRYYVFDKTTKKLNQMVASRKLLENITLSEMVPVSYQVAPDVNIPGYLTLPPGMTQDDAKNLPAIVMPHGGPSARDVWGFDWFAQFFANQGYAVLQPNYRGSYGYGDQWYIQNGFQSWRTAIGDINAGGRWLVSQGIADPDKMAIIGWSYGGYAALQSAVLEPGLFKAVGAVAPVTDFQDTINESRNFTNYHLVRNMIGSGAHITQGSPLRNVERISVPVILFHGDKDLNVSVRQSRLMEDALKDVGKPVIYHEYKGLDHNLPDNDVRTHMLASIFRFLKDSLQ